MTPLLAPGFREPHAIAFAANLWRLNNAVPANSGVLIPRLWLIVYSMPTEALTRICPLLENTPMPRSFVTNHALGSHSLKLVLGLGFVSLLIPAFAVAQGPAVADPDVKAKETTEVTFFGGSKLTVPGDFEPAKKGSSMLDYEFSAKAGEGDDAAKARVTMMASGGGVQPNIKRWQGQFAGGDAKLKKTEVMKVGSWKIHVVDNNGMFADRMGGGPFAGGKVVKREDWAMTGAILEHPEGRLYFVKMIGPAKVVKANRESLIKMLESVK